MLQETTFSSSLSYYCHTMVIDIDGNFELRSRQQLKHCLKHSHIGLSRWRINKQLVERIVYNG